MLVGDEWELIKFGHSFIWVQFKDHKIDVVYAERTRIAAEARPVFLQFGLYETELQQSIGMPGMLSKSMVVGSSWLGRVWYLYKMPDGFAAGWKALSSDLRQL